VRYLVASAILLVCGLVLLWREVAAPIEPFSTSRAPVPDHAARASTRPSVTSARGHAETPLTPSAPMATAATPPGGVRAWSPTAATVDGPDPFAPVPEVRTAADTRAGLAD
jgi:hypothetical protein